MGKQGKSEAVTLNMENNIRSSEALSAYECVLVTELERFMCLSIG